MGIQYTLVGSDDGSSVITVFVPGQKPLVAQSDHPNFDKIRDGVVANDESVAELFDVAETAAKKFERLSDRVTAANGRLFLDGEEINNALATQVVRFVGEGVDDWKPLVNFFENVQMNPQDDSREQLYDWLNAADFTITDDGMIVGYKGVRVVDGEFQSINTGKAIVDGEVKEGAIPNYIGAVVEMPRGEVTHDPQVHCHVGLHVGTYDYANNFARGALLEVHVHPRDVVSVPADHNGEKMRVCRYKVVNTIDKPYTESVVSYDDYYGDIGWGDGEDDDFCEDCGCEFGDCCCDDPEADDQELSLDMFSPLPLDGDKQNDPKVRGGQHFSSTSYGVSVGDKYEDQDQRRPRTLEVVGFGEDVANNEVVVKNLETGKLSSINALRLLTPYRFTRV